jgi:beta-glucosidase
VHLVAGHRYHLAMRWFAIAKAPVPRLGLQDVSPLIAAAARAARRAQVAVVFASDFNMEGVDRPSLSLPGDANALIAAVAAANPRTIVVLNTGGAVLMPWLKSVRAVLEAWYPGQVDGTATAAVLTGAVDPSGRLPLTFPRSQSVTPVAQPARYPGIAGVVTYSEGLNIGYRWYLATHHRPLFIFGSGLSYTHFRLGHAHLSRHPGEVVATVSVANTGAVSGTDVVQAYLADPRRAGEPPEQLRAFARVTLAPGTRRRVRLVLGRAAFAADLGGRWQVVPGTYRIGIGANAGDLAIELATRAPRPAPARRARMHRARRSQPYPPRHRRPLGQRPRRHHPLRHRPPARFGRTARPRPGGAARGTRR